MRWLLLVTICLAGVKSDAYQAVEGADSPAELTILKHELSFERTLTNSVQVVLAKVRNNTDKPIVGVTWYFVLNKNSHDEYFRIRFRSQTEIKGEKTKTLKGAVAKWPRLPRAVSVDELKNEIPVPPHERIVVTCLLFADGTFASLKDWPAEDCQRLGSPPKNDRQ